MKGKADNQKKMAIGATGCGKGRVREEAAPIRSMCYAPLSYDDGLIVVNHWSWYCYYLIGSAPPILLSMEMYVSVCVSTCVQHPDTVSLPFIDNAIIRRDGWEMDQKREEGRGARGV